MKRRDVSPEAHREDRGATGGSPWMRFMPTWLSVVLAVAAVGLLLYLFR